MNKAINWSIVTFAITLLSSFAFGQNAPKHDSSKIAKWFPKYDFNPAAFQKPAIQFAPFARWWWPGNDVNKAEFATGD